MGWVGRVGPGGEGGLGGGCFEDSWGKEVWFWGVSEDWSCENGGFLWTWRG